MSRRYFPNITTNTRELAVAIACVMQAEDMSIDVFTVAKVLAIVDSLKILNREYTAALKHATHNKTRAAIYNMLPQTALDEQLSKFAENYDDAQVQLKASIYNVLGTDFKTAKGLQKGPHAQTNPKDFLTNQFFKWHSLRLTAHENKDLVGDNIPLFTRILNLTDYPVTDEEKQKNSKIEDAENVAERIKAEVEMLEKCESSKELKDMGDAIHLVAAKIENDKRKVPFYCDESEYGKDEELDDFEENTHIFCERGAFKKFAEEEQKGTGSLNSRQNFSATLKGLTQPKALSLVNENMLDALEDLRTEMPNYEQVLESIKDQIGAQLRLNLPVKFEPILLVGPPGIGKTRFVKRLSEILKTPHFLLGMGGSGDAMRLRGLSRGWGSAKPGKFALDLAACECANPIYVLDEIDKAGRNNKDATGDVHGLLLAYLEEESSDAVEDDYMGITLDATPVNWLMTANDATQLPDTFLSRVDVYYVSGVEGDERRRVLIRMSQEVSEKWSSFVEDFDDKAIEKLDTYASLRDAKRAAKKAIARAVAEGSKVLKEEHFQELSVLKTARKSIGFINS